MIDSANALLTAAMRRMDPGPYQMQAVIAAHHANALTAEHTDWPAIAQLYQQLSAMTSSPVVALNRAVAVAMADGPQAGLAMLNRLTGLDRYHLYHAARGELLLLAGDPQTAAGCFIKARELTDNPAEQRHLERRLAACRRLAAE